MQTKGVRQLLCSNNHPSWQPTATTNRTLSSQIVLSVCFNFLIAQQTLWMLLGVKVSTVRHCLMSFLCISEGLCLVVNEFIQYNVFSPKASSRNLSGDRCLERVLVFLSGLKHPCLTPIEVLRSPVLPTESMGSELTCTFNSSQNKVEVTTATARRRMDERCPETDLK